MSLVVVAIFDDLNEGEIAASVLRSADIPCWLLGSEMANMRPLERRAWGGVRLAVPQAVAFEARDIICEARSGAHALEEPLDIPEPEARIWAPGLAVLAYFGGLGAAWGISGLRRRRSTFRIIGTLILLIGLSPFILYALAEAIFYLIADTRWILGLD